MKVESLKRASALALGVTMAFGVFAAPVVVLADEATEEVTAEYATQAEEVTENNETEATAEETAATEEATAVEESTAVEEEATVADEATEEVAEDDATEEVEEEASEEEVVAPAFETVTRTETVTLRFAVGESSFTKNGAFHAMEAVAFNRDGRVMLPLNAVGVALDAEVSVANEVATVVTSDASIALSLGVELPNGMGTPVVEYDVVFVPLGFIASSIGAVATWDAGNNAAYVTFNVTIVEEVPVAPPVVAEPVVEEPTEEEVSEVADEVSDEAAAVEEVTEDNVSEEVSVEANEDDASEEVSEEATAEVASSLLNDSRFFGTWQFLGEDFYVLNADGTGAMQDYELTWISFQGRLTLLFEDDDMIPLIWYYEFTDEDTLVLTSVLGELFGEVTASGEWVFTYTRA